jgi:hypothetical protein
VIGYREDILPLELVRLSTNTAWSERLAPGLSSMVSRE